MRVIEKTIFTFDELSDSAKEKAREWGREIVGSDMNWSDESKSSIKAFCDHFGVTLTDWSIGAYSPIQYSTDAENHHFRGHKLRDFNRGHMPTGYCLDCSLWQEFYDEFKRTGNAKESFDTAIYAGFKAWRDDLEDQLKDEQIDDFIIANVYEFDENGKKV